MAHTLDETYPRARHFMANALFGDDTFEREVDASVRGASSPEAVQSVIAELRLLLADPTLSDEDLDTFVLAHARWFIDQSGRRTLEKVVERLTWALDNPPEVNPLTRRAPTLTRLLEEHTRSRDELDDLVRAGAAELGQDAAQAAASEAQMLLADPDVGDDELSMFVRSHSWWFVQDSGRRTLERVVAALR